MQAVSLSLASRMTLAPNVSGARRAHETRMSHPIATVERMKDTLTDRERDILALERLWWQYPGEKTNEIRKRFDISSTQYYQQINTLIDREAALAFDPILVKRLRRLRSQRQRSRSTRATG